jgi:hypothetical protein
MHLRRRKKLAVSEQEQDESAVVCDSLQQTVYWGYSVQQKQLTRPQINPLMLHLHAEHEISQL